MKTYVKVVPLENRCPGCNRHCVCPEGGGCPPPPPPFDPKILKVGIEHRCAIWNLDLLSVTIPSEFMVEKTDTNVEVRRKLRSRYRVFPEDVNERLREWSKDGYRGPIEEIERLEGELDGKLVKRISRWGNWCLKEDEGNVRELVEKELAPALEAYGKVIREFLTTLKDDSIKALFDTLLLSWRRAERPWWKDVNLDIERDREEIYRMFYSRIEPDVQKLINDFKPTVSVYFSSLGLQLALTADFQLAAEKSFHDYLEQMCKNVLWLLGIEFRDFDPVP